MFTCAKCGRDYSVDSCLHCLKLRETDLEMALGSYQNLKAELEQVREEIMIAKVAYKVLDTFASRVIVVSPKSAENAAKAE